MNEYREIAASLSRARDVDALCGALLGGLVHLYRAPRGELCTARGARRLVLSAGPRTQTRSTWEARREGEAWSTPAEGVSFVVPDGTGGAISVWLDTHPDPDERHTLAGDLVDLAADLLDTFAATGELLSAQALCREAKRDADEVRDFMIESQSISRTGTRSWNPQGTQPGEWSPELFKLFGYDPRETVPSFEKLAVRVHPQERARYIETIRGAVAQRRDVEVEYRMLLPDGTLRHIRAKAKLVSPTLYVGCATDITERRVAESKVRRAHTELATAARLRTLGELAASITHELSQPLTAVVAHAAAGRRSLTATEPDAIGARLSVEALLEDARRAQGVISSLRTLARKSEPERRPVDIDAAVSEIVALLRGEIEAVGVDVRCALGAGGRRLMVDRVQIQQVVLTLIMTCLEGLKDAAYAPVPLSIRTYWSDGGAFQMVISGPARIADPPPMNARFELLAPDATGEQLGLAVCVSIVEAHGGSLTRVTSDLGGIAFELRLEEGEPA